MYYDLGASVSATKWVIKCRVLVNGSANTDEVLFGFQLNNTLGAYSNTNSDALGFYIYTDRANTWSRIYQVCKDNTTSVEGLSSTPRYYGNISSGTYYYMTLTRSSATDFKVEIRTGSHTGTLLDTLVQNAIPSTLTGLQYLSAVNYSQGLGQTMDISEVEFYNGVTTPSGRWGITDRNSSNHTGSGMSDSGYILQGNSSGGSAQQTILSFMDKKQFSNTGSVCIAVAKLGATGTNEQGGWGMCGDMPSYWLNGIKINVPQSGNIGFYTMDGSAEHLSDTGVAISTASSYHVYKLEQLDGSSKCSIDGVVTNDVTTGQPTTPMQPFVYSKFDNSAIHIKYMECYNT